MVFNWFDFVRNKLRYRHCVYQRRVLHAMDFAKNAALDIRRQYLLKAMTISDYNNICKRIMQQEKNESLHKLDETSFFY